MKIQKQVSDRRGDKTYYKHVVVIPEDKIKESGLKAGEELEVEAKKGEIRLRKNG
jgi:hypothetical protein